MTFISLVSMIINIKGKCILAFVTSLKPKALFIYIFLFVVPKHGEYHFTVWMECVTFLYGHFTFHLLLLQVSKFRGVVRFFPGGVQRADELHFSTHAHAKFVKVEFS